jgi:Protein of unknown function (DUF2950)
MFNHRDSLVTPQLSVARKLAGIALLAAGMVFPAAAQPSGQKTFTSATAASKALVAALKADDQAALLKILGPDAKDIVSSGDAAEDKTNRAQFVQKYEQMHRLVIEPNGTTTLYIGAENWPTPIPLVHQGDVWYFDTPAGKQEILYRRVGRNELATIRVCHELVDAEKEYHAQAHDGGSGVYAQKLVSDPGKHDGLYWQASAGESESPIGPLVAAASMSAAAEKHEPFNGYYFLILRGEKGPGGEQSYRSDGKMIKGFAFLAYPAVYRSSGVMTFIVDQDGVVYEKDLGKQTTEIAKSLTAYSRDATWHNADESK